MWKKIWQWVALLLLVVGLPFDFWYDRYNKKWLAKNGGRTEGVIELSGSAVVCTYQVGSTAYRYKRSRPKPDIQDGEKFVVAFDPADPENATALYYEPIITDEFRQTTSTRVTMLLDGDIQFSYMVNGESYERYNILPPDTEADEEKDYIVKYSPKNPKIAYIFLDTPTSGQN